VLVYEPVAPEAEDTEEAAAVAGTDENEEAAK
jgi:hypothetical protein